MKSKIMNIATKADAAVILATQALAVYRLCIGNIDGALLALIASGVWCISSMMATKIIAENRNEPAF